MKKIGILTHYCKSQNIGGLLQAYALPAWLNQHNFSAEQIAFDFLNSSDFHTRLVGLTTLSKTELLCKLLTWPYRQLKRQFNPPAPAHKPAAEILQTQAQKMAEFEHFIPHSAHTYVNRTLPQVNAHYDIFISGSDQVFATYLLPMTAYYGEFAAAGKKCISYAASSDVKQFSPSAEAVFCKKLAHLAHISVREKSLQTYIERLTARKVALVLDPTFLITPQAWLEIARPIDLPQKPYVFCYFLGDQSAWQRQQAQAYADRYGYELIHLPYIMQTVRPADQFLKGQGRFDVGPREFVFLIQNAACVFTDSFHGMAFSINFGKNFYVFNRDDKSDSKSMNARITDTLSALGLSARHLTSPDDKTDNAPLDFSPAHAALARAKAHSANWLLNALKD